MLVYRPIASNKKTQGFGENNACVRTNPSGQPYYPYKIIGVSSGLCPLGTKPFYPLIGLNGHNGQDNRAYYRESVCFPVIAETKWWGRSEVDAGGGIGVDVFSKDRVYIDVLPTECGELARRDWWANERKVYVKFRFWHLQSFLLEDKPKIQTGVFSDGSPQMAPEIMLGDVIGLADSTGASSGDHLHWAMKIVTVNGQTLDGDNGYSGAVDFSSLYTDMFILDMLGRKQVLSLSQHVAKVRDMFLGVPLVEFAFTSLLNKLLREGK